MIGNVYFLDPNPLGFPAVLLLPGLGANASSWVNQFSPLIESSFRPLTVDIPGFGQSPYDGRGWSIKAVTAVLARLLEDQKAAPAHVVGLSLGGLLAQQLALDYPQLVRKLVLVSTFSFLRPASLSQWLYFSRRLLMVHLIGMQAQAEIVAKRVFPGPDQAELREMAARQIAASDPRAYRAAMRSLGLFDTRNRLKEINLPSLVITGAVDTTVAPCRQKLLADAIPGARQVTISDAGHAVSIDQPDAFNRELLAFLTKVV